MIRSTLLCGLFSLSATAVAAAAADAPAAAPSVDVYVVPFAPLTPAPELSWVGRAVQQAMVADVTKAGLRPASPDDRSAADPRAAATTAGAKYVVTGTYQWADPRVRLTGQLVDAASGTPVAALSATGDGRDLFALEDDLSAQLVRALRKPAADLTPTKTQRPVPPALQPDAVAAAIAPPSAPADGRPGAYYQGSALQSYVEANKTPSNDYTQQVIDARDRNTYGSYNSTGFSGLGYGFGGPGYGGFGYGGIGGLGYGGFGYGGYGTGGYLLGVSYPVGSVGTYGLGGVGYQGFAGRGGFDYGGQGFGGTGGYFAGRGYNANGGFRTSSAGGRGGRR